MSTGNDILVRILRAEAARGHDNKAVIGGVSKIAPHWKKSAKTTGLDGRIIDTVTTKLNQYSSLSLSDRKLIADELLTMLTSHYAEIKDRYQTPNPLINDAKSIERDVVEEYQITDSELYLETPLTTVSGIGPSNSNKLKRLGLDNIRDAFYHFPHRYIDYSSLKSIKHVQYGDEVTIIAKVKQIRLRKIRGGKLSVVEIDLADETGTILCTWFNQPWLEQQLRQGQDIQVSGRIDVYLGKKVMSSPDWESVDKESIHTGRIVPIYNLTKGITAKTMRRWMHKIVHDTAGYIIDPLPKEMCARLQLPDADTALRCIHFPDSQHQLQSAQKRIAFSELLILHVGMRLRKSLQQKAIGQQFCVKDSWLEAAVTSLPFNLTAAQTRVVDEILNDISKSSPMSRLIQGDVGSGKTIVAALALAVILKNDAQGALMAPTSILAEQHYTSICALLKTIPNLDLGGKDASCIRLLLGSTPKAERTEIANGLLDGSINILIGTHTLIQDSVKFSNLALAVVDEQHRFGVQQRATLRGKGNEPHLIVMTATPIPRSLALTLYGDLDLSIIDELPPGRIPVETRVIYPTQRDDMYNFISKQIKNGGQAFLIYPIIEESDTLQVRAAVKEHLRLQNQVFSDFQVGLLHGKMKASDKYDEMTKFRNGDLDILVATTVIEVGVDIPNASIMVVENANRFGLAQLHQLRGRVGRGGQKSYCLLVADEKNVQRSETNSTTNDRLRIMESTTDGFVLAEKDLQLRGPGDFLGTNQTGFSFQIANLSDMSLIQLTLNEAETLLRKDPELDMPENSLLASVIFNSQHTYVTERS